MLLIVVLIVFGLPRRLQSASAATTRRFDKVVDFVDFYVSEYGAQFFFGTIQT